MENIEKYLEEHGPTLSGVILQMLQEKEPTVRQDALRQRLCRLPSSISKVKRLFKDNQSLLHLKSQFGSESFYEHLVDACKTDAKNCYSVIRAIQYHFGYIQKSKLASHTCCPIKNLTSHKLFSTIINELAALNVIIEETIEDDVYYKLNEQISSPCNFAHYKSLELAKRVVLNQFYDIVRYTGFVSFNKGEFDREFFKFQFDFTAPCYITGIRKGKNPAFVLCDVLIGNDDTGVESVEFFISKIDIIKVLSNSNFIPFLIVDGIITPDALKCLKEKGIVVGFVEKLFGKEYTELLRSLIATLTNAGAVLKNNPEQFIQFIEKLSKLVDGKTNNLRGDLFELAVGYYHSTDCQSLDIGKIIRNAEGKQRELDVYVSRQTSITICECKAYTAKTNKDTVQKWISTKIPVIYQWIKSFENKKKIVFEFWSASGFEDDAKSFLAFKQQETKKYRIEFYDEQDIMKKVQDSATTKIKDIMQEYFLKNP